MQTMTIERLNELFERSKNDNAMIVGSEIREVIGYTRDLIALLVRAKSEIFLFSHGNPELVREIEEAVKGTDAIAANAKE